MNRPDIVTSLAKLAPKAMEMLDKRDQGKLRRLTPNQVDRAQNQLSVLSLPVINALKGFVDGITHERAIEYYKKRMVIARKIAGAHGNRACLVGTNKNFKEIFQAKHIGNGAFGNVFQIQVGKEKRAAKIETLMNRWQTFQETLSRWSQEAELARLCGEISVGPRVYDAYLCRQGDVIHGVLLMDVVNGVSLQTWRSTASAEDVRTAETILDHKITALHDAGVFHRDLHASNVIVVPKTKKNTGVRDVYIVDYGFATTLPILKQNDRDDVQKLGAGRRKIVESEETAIQILIELIARKVIALSR